MAGSAGRGPGDGGGCGSRPGCRGRVHRTRRRPHVLLHAASVPHPAAERGGLADRHLSQLGDESMDAAQLGAELLAALQQKGWNTERSATTEPLLPPDVQARYPRLPAELTSFLSAIESCANAEENVWFLCRED